MEKGPGHQATCWRCGVLKGNAERPLVTTARGWLCGYCVRQIKPIAEHQQALIARERITPAAVLELLCRKGPLTVEQVGEQFPGLARQAAAALHVLHGQGLVERDGEGTKSHPHRYKAP